MSEDAGPAVREATLLKWMLAVVGGLITMGVAAMIGLAIQVARLDTKLTYVSEQLAAGGRYTLQDATRDKGETARRFERIEQRLYDLEHPQN